MVRARRDGRLPVDLTHRLYEALATVAAAVPANRRRALIAVWRRPAWQLPDTGIHRHLRGVIFRDLPDLARDDWKWILKVLPDDGAAAVFKQWGTDAGFFRATST